jgi:hypothetical protein
MKADLLFHQRIDYDDGGIVEMTLWRVPSPVPPTTHGLKYSLFYGRTGFERLDTTMSVAKAIIGIFRASKRLTRLAPSSN